MISSKLIDQLEFSFSAIVCWEKLSRENRQEILEQLSLLFLSSLAEGIAQNKSIKEDQLCQVK